MAGSGQKKPRSNQPKLGQHFLVNRNVAEKIAGQFFPVSGPILEIGPGKGILTDYLLKLRQKDNPLTAIELDNSLFYKLKHQFEGFDDASVLNRDILKIQLETLFPDPDLPVNVIGNVPYYISKEIMDWVIKYYRKIRKGVFMVQKEFADKIMSGGGKDKSNPQSVISEHLFKFEKCFDVQPGSFSPHPKVKSTVFRFERKIGKIKDDSPVDNIDVLKFYNFLKQCFKNRRKTLLNNISEANDNERLWAVFENLQINPRIRAEQLALEELRNIFLNYFK
jgi:16S rRNA (adenine1518-N6/adenine1519-N6)-dimethyltransferase